jgi:hypothetical protein
MCTRIDKIGAHEASDKSCRSTASRRVLAVARGLEAVAIQAIGRPLVQRSNRALDFSELDSSPKEPRMNLALDL